MNPSERRGRRLLLTVIVGSMAISLVLLALQGYLGRLKPSSFVRTCLEAGLLYRVWQGAKWARWLMAVLSALGGAYGLALGMSLGPPVAIPLILMGVLYYAFALILAKSRDLRAFLLSRGKAKSKHPIDMDFA